jgi:peroxiredoxin
MKQRAIHFALPLLGSTLLALGLHRITNGEDAPETGVTIYIFLAEDCPISQSATLTLKTLYREYDTNKIEFIGVFANSASTEASMAQFQQKYEIPFTLKFDADNRIMKSLGARVTPEVFVVGQPSRRILYKGRIDDSFARVGQRRQIVTAHELREALSAITDGRPIAVKETRAIGCYITPRQ